MQRFRTDPAGVRVKPAHTFHEPLNALADRVVNVEGDENAHNGRWSSVVRRRLEPFRPTANGQRPTANDHPTSASFSPYPSPAGWRSGEFVFDLLEICAPRLRFLRRWPEHGKPAPLVFPR